jgi:hypothetical protein
MARRSKLFPAILIGAAIIAWWLSGIVTMAAVCKASSPLSLFHGPFSSLCYRFFPLDAPAD